MKTRQIVCEENQRRLIVSAPSHFSLEKIKIDGALIADNTTEKCDFAVTVHHQATAETKTPHTYILVELKGGDIKKAVSQLETTIKQPLIQKHYQGFNRKHAYAICSKVQMPGFDTFKQRQAMLLRKNHGFILEIRTREHTHQIKE